MSQISTFIFTSKGYFCYTGGGVACNATAGIRFVCPTGTNTSSGVINATESNEQIPMVDSGTLKLASMNVIINGNTASGTFTLRKNSSSPTNGIVITVTASTTGIFSDFTNSVAVSTGDLICWQASQATTATTTAVSIIVEMRP